MEVKKKYAPWFIIFCAAIVMGPIGALYMYAAGHIFADKIVNPTVDFVAGEEEQVIVIDHNEKPDLTQIKTDTTNFVRKEERNLDDEFKKSLIEYTESQ